MICIAYRETKSGKRTVHNVGTTNILHISDLHYKFEHKFNQEIVLNALLDDIRKQSDRVGEPDLIVFSGDLVHNADDPDAYDKLYDAFIENLLDATNCDHSRLYLVPGNHDLHRTAVKGLEDQHNRFAELCVTRDALNEQYLSGNIFEFAQKKSRKFFDFRNFFESEGTLFSNEIVQVYDLPEKDVSLVCLNTAWMGFAGLDQVKDLSKLLLPEAALVQAFKYVPEGRFVVGAQHHPSSWLTEFCDSDFKDRSGGKIDLQLVGHVHDPRPIVIRNPCGTTFQNQSGALYIGREDRYLGYSYIRIFPKDRHIEACWRSYYDKRGCFDDATNVNDTSGWLYSSKQAERYFEELFDDSKKQDVKRWVSKVVKNQFEKDFEKGLLDRPTTELFVAPPLHRQVFTSGNDEELDTFEKVEITFRDLCSISHNVLLQAKSEYGKTTLLQQLCISRSKDAVSTENDRHFIPVLLKFSDFSPGTKRVERAIRNALPDFPGNCAIESLLQNGAFLVCIDDVIFSNGKNMKELKLLISTYKSNRYILSTIATGKYEGVKIDTGLPAQFDQVTVGTFRRKGIRSLVRKWNDNNSDEEELLNRVVRELKAINVPYTPLNSTLLLDIISNDQSFSPLNRPTLIERFIETLLKKRSLSDIERRKFDFRNQVHYLGYVAEYMCKENRYILDYDDLFRITAAYLENLGLSFGAQEIIENSITSRIFQVKMVDKSVSFRFRVFLNFFIATQMKANQAFKEWIFEEERYLSYLNEIEYYAGLERNDLDLLYMVAERHEKCLKEAFGEKFLSAYDENGDGLIYNSFGDKKYSEDLAATIGETPMSAEERDEVLDTEIPADAEGRQEVFRPDTSSPHARYILSLVMYTGLVKNTELIKDSDKRIHLAKVLRSWAITTMIAFLAIPGLVKHRKMTVNGLTYTVSYPMKYSDKRIEKLISINMPMEIGRLLFSLIGTEKLEVQLTQKLLSESRESRIVSYFRNSLCMDLKFRQWWKIPGQFSKQVKIGYFREVMLAKATELYHLGGFSKEVETELQDEIVDSFARLYAPAPEQIRQIRSRKKANMTRAKLLNFLRAEID